MKRFRFGELLQWQVDRIREEGCLSEVQDELLSHLLRGRLLDKGIAREMGMSQRTFYRHKRQLVDKALRVLGRDSAHNCQF